MTQRQLMKGTSALDMSVTSAKLKTVNFSSLHLSSVQHSISHRLALVMLYSSRGSMFLSHITLSHISCKSQTCDILTIIFFTITAEILGRSLPNFYRQCADRRMNLKFVGRVSEKERAIRPFGIVKSKLTSVFNESVLLLTMNFVITLLK